MTDYLFKPGDKVTSKFNDQGVIVKINIHRTIKGLHTYTVNWGNGKVTATAPAFLQSPDENMCPKYKKLTFKESK